jgi:hypothetical protein
VSASQDLVAALLLQPDQKILAAGSAEFGGYDFALVRLLSDGTPDPSFDGDGIVTTPIGVAHRRLLSTPCCSRTAASCSWATP